MPNQNATPFLGRPRGRGVLAPSATRSGTKHGDSMEPEFGQDVETIASELIDRLTAIANYLAASRVLLGRSDPAQSAEVRSVIDKAHAQAISAADIVKRLQRF
jgi:hypothetical protein